MKTKIVYTLDKTKDEDLEYANLLDAMVFAVNIAKSRDPESVPHFEYNIVDDTLLLHKIYLLELSLS